MALDFEKINETTLRIDADYSEIFEYVKSNLVATDGEIKKDEQSAGLLIAQWKHGIDPMGLKVTVQFRTVKDSTIEINFRGDFKSVFSSAGKDKAIEMLRVIAGESVQEDKSTLVQDGMPPRLGDDNAMNNGKSRKMAGLWAILLGGGGAHKFYLGSWGLGICYILSIFLIPGLSALVGIIEGIRCLTLKDNEFDEKYNYCEIKPFDVKW